MCSVYELGVINKRDVMLAEPPDVPIYGYCGCGGEIYADRELLCSACRKKVETGEIVLDWMDAYRDRAFAILRELFREGALDDVLLAVRDHAVGGESDLERWTYEGR